MVVLKDMEVYVVSSRSGERLVEYDNPNPDAAIRDRETEKFIEAKSDEEFYISVNLKAGFSYYAADGVKIYLNIDGAAVDCVWYAPKDVSSIRHKKLVNDISYQFRDLPAKRGNGWVDVAFAFGKAEPGRCWNCFGGSVPKIFYPDEELHLEPAALRQQIKEVGTIVVCLARVTSRSLKHPRDRMSLDPCPVGQIDKKLIRQNISNTLKWRRPNRRCPRRMN